MTFFYIVLAIMVLVYIQAPSAMDKETKDQLESGGPKT